MEKETQERSRFSFPPLTCIDLKSYKLDVVAYGIQNLCRPFSYKPRSKIYNVDVEISLSPTVHIDYFYNKRSFFFFFFQFVLYFLNTLCFVALLLLDKWF